MNLCYGEPVAGDFNLFRCMARVQSVARGPAVVPTSPSEDRLRTNTLGPLTRRPPPAGTAKARRPRAVTQGRPHESTLSHTEAEAVPCHSHTKRKGLQYHFPEPQSLDPKCKVGLCFSCIYRAKPQLTVLTFFDIPLIDVNKFLSFIVESITYICPLFSPIGPLQPAASDIYY